MVAGFEQSLYAAAEQSGAVRVCVQLTGQLARSALLMVSTLADGQAQGTYIAIVLNSIIIRIGITAH